LLGAMRQLRLDRSCEIGYIALQHRRNAERNFLEVKAGEIPMATKIGSQVARAKPRHRSLLSRIFEALHESRMIQARREIARHRHLFPDDARSSDDVPYFGS
jgi:hypothetical protein